MSFVFKFAKYLKWILFVLFVCVALVFWLTNTHSGNTLTFSLLQKIEPRLNIELTDGSLFYSPEFQQIRWEDGETLIELNNVSYEFDWQCLFEEVCLDSLIVQSATINIPETESEVTEEEVTEPFVLTFPLPVHVKHLDIKQTNVKVAGVEIDIKQLILAADGVDNDLTLNADIQGLTVTLPDSGTELANQPVNTTEKTGVNEDNKDDIDTLENKTVNTINEKGNTTLNTGTKTAQSTSVIQDPSNVNVQNLLERFPAILTDETLPEVILPFNLIAQKVQLSDFKLIQDQQSIVTVNQFNTKLTYFSSLISIEALTLDIPEANLDLTGNIDLSKRYPMDLHAFLDIKEINQLEPSTLLSGQKVELTSKGDLGNLDSTLTLTKLINAKAHNKIDLYSDNLPHELELSWDKITWPLTGTPEITVSKGELVTSGNLDDYNITLKGDYLLPDVPTGSINLAGKGNLRSMSLSQLLVNTLQGSVLLKGKLDWVDNLTWLGDLSINNINFKEISPQYPGKLSGYIKQSVTIPLKDNNKPAWTFDVPTIDVNGSFLTRPLTIKGAVKGDAKSGLNVNNLKVVNGVNTVFVNGKIADKSDLILDLNIQDLSNIIIEAAGNIQGKVALAGSLDKIQVNSALNAKNIRYQDNRIEQLTVTGKATLADIPFANLTLNAKNIVANNQKIDTVDIAIIPNNVTTKQVTHDISIDLKSKLVSTDLALLFTQERKTWQAKLNQGVIKTAQAWLVLDKPFIASMDKTTLNLTDHCWSITDNVKSKNGQLCVNKFSAGDNGDIQVALDDYLLSALTPFIPNTLTLEGAIDSDINVAWKKKQKPSIDLLLQGKKIALNIQTEPKQKKFTHYPVDQLRVDLNTSAEKADFEIKVNSDGLINANLDGHITPYQETPEIDAKLDLTLPDFDAFSTLIPQIEELTGSLQAAINISGPLDKPEMQGQVLIADTTVVAPSSPVQVSELNTEITIDKNNAQISGFFFTNSQKSDKQENKSLLGSLVSLKDAAISTVSIPQRIANIRKMPLTDAQSKGRVDISGVVDWANKLKATIKLNGQQMLINDYGMLKLYVSPDIDIIYDDQLSIEGTVKVDKGNITVKELPAGAVSVSKDVVIVDAKTQDNTADLPVKLNIKVSLGNRLRLKALGLDTLIHGDLLVRKTLKKDLTVNGELTFSDGSYRAFSQQLVLQNSRIVFQGSPSSPYLNIEAIRDPNNIEDNVTAGVRVTGTPDQLQIKVFSDTAMSQQNALSYITRGRSIDSDSGDNSQLTSMLIGLGTGQTDEVLNNIGDTIGVDNLTLSSSGQGSEQSVGLKGTIARGVEVSYGVGVFDTFTIFAIRYELFKQFYIEASSGLYQAVDAYYEWDWD